MSVFFDMIREIRLSEKLSVMNKLIPFTESENQEIIDFLQKEYFTESYDYPYNAPDFDSLGAIFGAKVLYISAHLLIDRKLPPEKLANLFPPIETSITPSVVLSADLCLRFIPDIILWLRRIDSEDPLIPILEHFLKEWHFSGIYYFEDFTGLDFSVIKQEPCLKQMYIDRLVKYDKNFEIIELE